MLFYKKIDGYSSSPQRCYMKYHNIPHFNNSVTFSSSILSIDCTTLKEKSCYLSSKISPFIELCYFSCLSQCLPHHQSKMMIKKTLSGTSCRCRNINLIYFPLKHVSLLSFLNFYCYLLSTVNG